MKNINFLRLIFLLPIFIVLVPQDTKAQVSKSGQDTLPHVKDAYPYSGPHGSSRPRFKTEQDSLHYLVDSRPDSMRHGFFNAGKFNSTFHVQFDGDVTYLYQQVAALTGFQVAWVANHKLSIGAKFDILTSPVRINKYINTLDTFLSSNNVLTPNPIHPLSMSAMVTVGYIFRSDKKISIEPNLGVGWTYMSFTDPKVGWIDPTEPKTVNFVSNYLIVNPSLSVIWNTTKYFRIGAVVGAQGVFGTDYLRLKTYRIRGLYGGLFLRFGTF